MCGIVGYVGKQSASDVLMEGLKRLEYRGYDSAGVAILSGSQLELAREVGKLRNLEKALIASPISGSVGIGHTRWATHGRPTAYNAHPHTDCSGDLVVVHNGIIENYLLLKNRLISEGHVFQSDTDSEVIAHLIESCYQGDILQAVFKAIHQLDGAFALGVIHRQEPDRVIGVKMGNPLIVGVGEGENFIASDIPAILAHTRDILYLEDGEVVLVTEEKVQVFKNEQPVKKDATRIDWNIVAAEKAGFEHFMLKEIHEQPTTLTNTLGGRIDEREGRLYLDELGISDEEFRRFKRVTVIACGTALYSGLVGKYLIEGLARIPVEVDFASEFRYRDPVIDSETLVIAISQSGETADTLAALREANRLGATSIGIINTKGSAIAREVKGNLYIHAGPEIGVASTKAYTAMVAALTMLALHLGKVHGRLDEEFIRSAILDLKHLPTLISDILEDTTAIQAIAAKFQHHRDFLFLGRGINFPTAMEGALKLKEISYIHAEAYAAGEMKHGPIALIDESMPILAIATQSKTYEKVVSNLQEVKARGGTVICLATEGDEEIRKHADYVIELPPCNELISPIVNVIPCQLLSYYIAKMRGCDVDQPRNLAKSVTVE